MMALPNVKEIQDKWATVTAGFFAYGGADKPGISTVPAIAWMSNWIYT